MLPASSSPSLQGSWEFNQNVYDYSASQPMANVLSWEAPRLVRPQPDCLPLPACCLPPPAGHRCCGCITTPTPACHPLH